MTKKGRQRQSATNPEQIQKTETGLRTSLDDATIRQQQRRGARAGERHVRNSGEFEERRFRRFEEDGKARIDIEKEHGMKP